MDRVRTALTKALGEKAASDFIEAALKVKDPQDIKKRVCALLDTRKPENRQVYEILIREKAWRDAFPLEGYRKTGIHANATVPLEIGRNADESKPTKGDNANKSSRPQKSRGKPKFYPLFGEGAHRDQMVVILPGRHPCQCLATKHQLVNNCTFCGRIVCAQEGSGMCYFCGHLVCSQEERQKIESGTKQAVKLRNRLLQAPWAPGTEEPLYRVRKCIAKVPMEPSVNKDDQLNPHMTNNEITYESGGNDVSEGSDDTEDIELMTYTPMFGAQKRLEEGLAAAIANRDRLLEYDATSARRTRVLDDEMDYFTSEGSGAAAMWLDPETRERIQKRASELRAQRHASRLETMRICLDFAGREVVVEDTRDEAARQLYDPTQVEIEEWGAKIRSGGHSSNSSGQEAVDQSDTIADPTLGVARPKFVLPNAASQPEPGSNNLPQNPLVRALRHPLAGLRLQEDSPRQIADEGYCLSMHQPWASFLVRGIKRDEGRVWYSTHRGPLWIASTSKAPDPMDVETMEHEFIASGGVKDDLPTSYPTGCLLGRVNVVDVLTQEQYRSKFPDGPSMSPFVFICDDPREVLIKFPISGKHKIYKLDRYLHIAAAKNLA